MWLSPDCCRKTCSTNNRGAALRLHKRELSDLCNCMRNYMGASKGIISVTFSSSRISSARVSSCFGVFKQCQQMPQLDFLRFLVLLHGLTAPEEKIPKREQLKRKMNLIIRCYLSGRGVPARFGSTRLEICCTCTRDWRHHREQNLHGGRTAPIQMPAT